MKLPQFTAERALYRSTRQYAGGRRGGTPSEVVSQLMGSRFSRWPGGVFGTLGDYWTCRDACGRAHSACLDTCEGTWASPKGSTNCIICDDDYRACLQGCASDIA